MRLLAIVALAAVALLAPATSEAQAQPRSERSDRAPRRPERPERREPISRPERTDRSNATERAGPANTRALECPTGTTCRMVCMWAGGRREYENVRSATVTYGPGGSSALEVSVRTDEGQPLGMVFGMGLTCVGESIRATGGP